MLPRFGDSDVLRVLGEGGGVSGPCPRWTPRRAQGPARLAPGGRRQAARRGAGGLARSSSNVVEMIDFFVQQGLPVLVLGFIEGCALRVEPGGAPRRALTTWGGGFRQPPENNMPMSP
jgi:hypothetical protein